MSFKSINFLGGMDNISRLLIDDGEIIDDGQIIFEVFDEGKINNDIEFTKIISHLGNVQILLPPQYALNTNELSIISNELEKRHKQRVIEYQKPLSSMLKPAWHISPPQGLLNDPNGFIFHDGKYHLFYQWNPFECVHGDKYWAHLISDDLINWQEQPIALTPSDWYDSYGVFSGHAISLEKELILFYTGNVHIGSSGDRKTYQCSATSSDGVTFQKLGPVIKSLPKGVTAHIRDPKVFKRGSQWLMLLGAQTDELLGRLAVYSSHNLKDWHFKHLLGDTLGDFGYMWECPDYFEIEGQGYVVICPQGVKSNSEYNSIIHQNGIAKTAWYSDTGFTLSNYQCLDFGFDFYAPQTLKSPDGRRILCGWMGLPDEIDQPSTNDGWVHQLTCMREISIKNDQIIQWPIKEIDSLFSEGKSIYLTACSEHILTHNILDITLQLDWGYTLKFKSKDEEFVLTADKNKKSLIIDRSKTLNRATDVKREVILSSSYIDLRILLDNSSIELFINHGEAVMTSRIFTSTPIQGIESDCDQLEVLVKQFHG